MRSSRRPIAALAAVASVLSLGLAAPAAAATTGDIQGWAYVNGISDVSGVAVRLYDATGAVVRTTSTNAHGDYAFTALDSGRYRICFDGSRLRRPQAPIGLAAACYDDVTTLRAATPVAVGNGSTAYPVSGLAAAAILTGTVRDTVGNPLAGAPVTDGHSTFRTGADGTYRVRVAAVGVQVCVDGSKVVGPTSQVGYLDACHTDDTGDNGWQYLTPGSVTTDDFALDPAATLSGRVTDQSGRPLGNVTVYADGGSRWAQAVTGADGVYHLTRLAGHERYTIRYTTSEATGGGSTTGYLPLCYGSCYPYTFVATTAGADRTGLDVTVRWAGGASGRVTDRAGAAIAGVTVEVGGGYARTAADGTWSVTGLTPGPTTACYRTYGQVRAPNPDGYEDGCWPDKPVYQGKTFRIVGGQVTSGIVMHLVGQGGASGRVVTANGTPVSGVQLTLDADTTHNGYGSSGSDGRFRVGELEPGSYRLCLEPSGDTFAPRCVDTPVVVREGRTTTIPDSVLQAAGTIAGTVTDDSGQALSDVEVDVDGAAHDEVYTDGDGHYSVTGLPAGDYTVCFRSRFADQPDASGRTRDDQCYDDVWSDASQPFGTDGAPVPVGVGAHVTGIDAQLHPRTEITGVVTDRQGRPIGNVGIVLDGGYVTTSSGLDGTYTVEAVRPGTHTLCFDGGPGFGAVGDAGYSSQCWRNKPMGSPSPLNVPAHQQVVVDAKLTPLPAG